MSARIELRGPDVFCTSGTSEIRLPLADHLDRMRDWARRYDHAVRASEPHLLVPIGTEMFDWLNQQAWISRWIEQPGARVLEITVTAASSEADALLDVPWEILRGDTDFLAADGVQLFQVFRRIGTAHAAPPAPAYSDLTVMFMAASPEGQRELDYEAEEIGILDATKGLPLRLSVEESGNLEFLGRRLSADGPFDVLHLSCHGDIDPAKGPILLLEGPGGEKEIATATGIVTASAAHLPLLAFVSACRTAETAGTSGEPFVRALVRSGIANVLGWDGSVRDTDASRFASVLYGHLAKHCTVPHAAAIARQELLSEHRQDPASNLHWHLARVYCGPHGAAPLNAHGKPRRPKPHDVQGQFLADDRQVPVAPANKFVGRRREAQRIIRTLRGGKALGVLIQGMGNLGKSSLAARVADRLRPLRPVVVFGRYDALSILEKLAEAVSDTKARLAWSNTWKELVTQRPECLAEAVEDLLTVHLQESPILVIVDDLERILEDPAPGQIVQPVKTAYQPVLAALFKGFKAAASASHLLLTSRYRFTLSDGKGHDWARDIVVEPLHAMEDRQRRKQWRAATTAAAATPPRTEEERQLVTDAIQAAGGNPGLQDILCRPVLNGEVKAARQAIDAVQRFRDTGTIQVDEASAREFLNRVFVAYAQALQDSERRQMRAATLFSEGMPVPVAVLEEAGKAFAIAAPGHAIARLLALGLMDDWGMIDSIPHAALNPLARGLAQPPLSDEEQSALATAVLPPLAALWRDKDGDIHYDERGIEAMRLALLGEAPPDVLDAAATAGGKVLFHRDHDAKTAYPLLCQTLERLGQHDFPPSLSLLMIAADCAKRLGKRDAQIAWLRQGAERDNGDNRRHAQITATYAEASLAENGPEQTLATLRKAAAIFQRAEDDYSHAVTKGKIANILAQRGQTDEALRIHREEQLPVYDKLGDIRSRAVTMGKIADILQQRGQTDEALRIRREEQLPVFDRLGDIRSRAVTMGKIADILEQGGQGEEALRIRLEEQLPVFDKLGDIRSRAVTMGKIADILEHRGQTDEALRIRREEQLPVYDKLGDIRSRAVTMGKIADILQQRGQTDEALRIRREEELPVFDKLGDIRERAITMGKIADILERRGQTEEALRIRREEELPVYDKLGDIRSRAVTMGQIADILQQRGQSDEALRIRREEQLPVYDKLGDIRSRAVTMGKIADILEQGGQIEEALRIRLEECLPLHRQQQDIHSVAYILSACARLRLRQNGLVDGQAQIIADELGESFSLNLQLQRPDGIAMVGTLYGQVLAAGGFFADARKVLTLSAQAFLTLQKPDLAAQVQGLIAKIDTLEKDQS